MPGQHASDHILINLDVEDQGVYAVSAYGTDLVLV